VNVRYDSRYQISRSPQGQYAYALELSATADGRLATSNLGLVWFNETPWNPNTWTSQFEVRNLYDNVVNDVHGLRQICRRVDVSGGATCAPEQLESFASVYPLAAHPIYLADGRRAAFYGPGATDVTCGYPWITPEGTDLICRPTPSVVNNDLQLPASVESGTGINFFVVGAQTGWIFQRLDTGAHLKRVVEPAKGTNRPFSLAFLATSTGFWADRSTPSEQLAPFLRQNHVFEFILEQNALSATSGIAAELTANGLLVANTGKTKQYTEVSFAPALDPSTLLYLPMNEMFYDAATFATTGAVRAKPMMADASANLVFAEGAPTNVYPYFVALRGDANFAADRRAGALDSTNLSGFRGTHAVFGPSGSGTVRSGSPESPCLRAKGCVSKRDYDKGFTAQVAILPHANPVPVPVIPLVDHRGLWRLSLNAGKPHAQIAVGEEIIDLEGPTAVGSAEFASTPGVQAPLWTHLAVRVSDRAPDGSRVADLFVNGSIVQTVRVRPGARLHAESVDGDFLVVGPSGAPGLTGLISFDEFSLRDGAAESRDIRAAAGASTSDVSAWLTAAQARALMASWFRANNLQGMPLAADGFPLTLDPSALRIPSEFSEFVNEPARFSTLVQLGKNLFNTPAFAITTGGAPSLQAGTGQPMTCATCHAPSRAFTTADRLAVGRTEMDVNAPTLINRALGTAQFFDRRAANILQQVLQPIDNPAEIAGSVATSLALLNGAGEVAQAPFRAAFGTNGPWREEHLAKALAAYLLVQLSASDVTERVVASAQPVVDEQGNALDSATVRRGRDLFSGKARCAACHGGPNFSDELVHDTGIAAVPRAIKTPTLWDIGRTAPYFHDGSKASLEEVVRFYVQGGTHSGRNAGGLRLLDPELRPLPLDGAEAAALVQYLRTLRNNRGLLP